MADGKSGTGVKEKGEKKLHWRLPDGSEPEPELPPVKTSTTGEGDPAAELPPVKTSTSGSDLPPAKTAVGSVRLPLNALSWFALTLVSPTSSRHLVVPGSLARRSSAAVRSAMNPRPAAHGHRLPVHRL